MPGVPLLGILRKNFAPKKSRPQDGGFGPGPGGPGGPGGPRGPGGGELAEENQVLREENNMLKLKVELLLDMLADASADGQRPNIDDQWDQPCARRCDY